jgi:hypothetical protein
MLLCKAVEARANTRKKIFRLIRASKIKEAAIEHIAVRNLMLELDQSMGLGWLLSLSSASASIL